METFYDVRIKTWLATYPNAEYGITEEDIRNQVVGKQGELRPASIERWRQRIEVNNSASAMFVARLGVK